MMWCPRDRFFLVREGNLGTEEDFIWMVFHKRHQCGISIYGPTMQTGNCKTFWELTASSNKQVDQWLKSIHSCKVVINTFPCDLFHLGGGSEWILFGVSLLTASFLLYGDSHGREEGVVAPPLFSAWFLSRPCGIILSSLVDAQKPHNKSGWSCQKLYACFKD